MLLCWWNYSVSFKPVVLENLKTIDVQHPDNCVLSMDPGVVVSHLDDVIDPSHNPAEQTLVHGLRTTTALKGIGVQSTSSTKRTQTTVQSANHW